MKVIKILGREVGLEEDSHEEILGHFLTFGVGLLEVIDWHNYSNINSSRKL